MEDEKQFTHFQSLRTRVWPCPNRLFFLILWDGLGVSSSHQSKPSKPGMDETLERHSHQLEVDGQDSRSQGYGKIASTNRENSFQ